MSMSVLPLAISLFRHYASTKLTCPFSIFRCDLLRQLLVTIHDDEKRNHNRTLASVLVIEGSHDF